MKANDIITKLVEYITEHNITEMTNQQIMSKVYDLAGNKDLGINIIKALVDKNIIETNSIKRLPNGDLIYKINLQSARKLLRR